MAKKIQNKLKAKKYESVDKVARRTIKRQAAFDEATVTKRGDCPERSRKDAWEKN